MAIYHFSAKVISRANGSSAVAAAAYRAAERLHDDRLERAHDFSTKDDVIHSEIMSPEGSPERWSDRETLWNEVEARERQKNSQLAREVEFALPREMSQVDGVKLARDFVQREFVDRGMVADLNVHWDRAEDGSFKPHAHVMLTMRKPELGPDGEVRFGPKAREWNDRAELQGWRERWADHVNERLLELGIEARIDHRTLRAQGIELEPQSKIGPAGMRREERGEDAERAAEHREIARRNGEKIIADPSVALDAITRQQSTFTDHDLARFAHRHSDDAPQYGRVLSAVKTSPELVALGQDDRGRERFTTREMIEVERRLERSAERMVEGRGHEVSATTLNREIAAAEGRGLHLGGEQRDALEHISRPGGLAMTVGFAGTGKSAMLGVAREAWERSGYQVRGAALSGIAAENLEAGSAIPSRTIASLEYAWGQGKEQLTSKDVLVIDEAGMIGSRQMQRVLEHAEAAGAKVVLVGDPEQLQAIEAGAAFRALAERHGAAEITEVRRQREDWQRDATRQLATGRTRDALERYEGAGMITGHASRDKARSAVVAGWNTHRVTRQDGDAPNSQVMLAHTNADVLELNQLARERMREAGALGEERQVKVERGERAFAEGDRLMFLRNERSMGVKNGTLGTLERADPGAMTVRLDDGRQVAFDLKDYAHFDHGYAATIHKAQGVTVDQAHVLATPGLDRHAAYVGLTRHRDGVAVHYGADDFRDRQALGQTLSRERAKDTTLDYEQAFAERRGINHPKDEIRLTPELVRGAQAPRKRGRFDGLKLGKAPEPKRDMFAGLKLDTSAIRAPDQDRARTPTLDRAVRNYASAVADIEATLQRGHRALPHQEVELGQADKALGAIDQAAAADLRSALARNPGLAVQAETPAGLEKVKREMAAEAHVRATPELRAERFVETWKALQAERGGLSGWEKEPARKAVEARMGKLAEGLQRDPQMESVLRARTKELGLGSSGQSLGQDLQRELTRSLGLGRGMGMSR